MSQQTTSRSAHADRPTYRLLRWMYRSGRPNGLARVLNRISAIQFSTGWILPSRMGALEVVGRRTGRVISFPVAIVDYQGERYIVAMLGENSNWVRNVRAAGGRAVLRHGRREAIRLEEVESGVRAPILQRYLVIAPGARPHIPVDQQASLADFEQVAPQVPVFRITPDTPLPG